MAFGGGISLDFHDQTHLHVFFFLVCFVAPGSQEEPKRIDVSSQRAVLEKAGFVYPIGFM